MASTLSRSVASPPRARKRPLPTRVEAAAYEAAHVYHSRRGVVPHPFRLFPRPMDQITSIWMAQKTKRTLAEYERVYPWVDEVRVLSCCTPPTTTTDNALTTSSATMTKLHCLQHLPPLTWRFPLPSINYTTGREYQKQAQRPCGDLSRGQ